MPFKLWVHQTTLPYNWLPWVWPLLAAKWNGVSPLSFLGCRNTIRWMMVVTTGLENISTPKIFNPIFSSQTTIQILLFQPVWLKTKCKCQIFFHFLLLLQFKFFSFDELQNNKNQINLEIGFRFLVINWCNETNCLVHNFTKL